jgi:hypothetical protein
MVAVPPCRSFTTTVAEGGEVFASSLVFSAIASFDSWAVPVFRNSVSSGNSKTKSPPSEPGRLPKAGVW